jgi:hypothetical protein
MPTRSTTTTTAPARRWRNIRSIRRTVIAAAIALLAVSSAGAAAAAPAAAATGRPVSQATGVWGKAEQVAAALNQGGFAALMSVSCPSAGNCSAGGYYLDSSGNQQAFVVTETNGTWGTAEQVLGIAAQNLNIASTVSVSCASAGNCSAGGYYVDTGNQQAFVVTQTNGTWGTAVEVPGTAAFNQGGLAQISSVSCASPGNCSAGGYYTDSFSTNHQQAFVVSEKNGTWGTAREVPGTAALNQGGLAQITSVSCAAAGNCSAVGFYADSSGHGQAFVVNEKNGTWGTAREVPGTAALNRAGLASTTSVSCASAGNCSAGGFYADSSGREQAFVVSQANGTWGTARKIRKGSTASITSVSCASAGNCGAGGSYRSRSGPQQAFVVSQANGTWGTAQQVPGTAALNAGGMAGVQSVSCPSAGNCGAGGAYTDSSGHPQAFVVSQANGTWGTAQEIPGTAALNAGGDAAVLSVSCASAGNCSAGGSYRAVPGSNDFQAFVVNETNR